MDMGIVFTFESITVSFTISLSTRILRNPDDRVYFSMNERKSDKGHETGDFLLVHFPPCSFISVGNRHPPFIHDCLLDRWR